MGTADAWASHMRNQPATAFQLAHEPALDRRAGFLTFQEDKVQAGRLWTMHRRCTIQPLEASQIRTHDRHLRKTGPLSAVRAYRDKRPIKLVRCRPEVVAAPARRALLLPGLPVCFSSAPHRTAPHHPPPISVAVLLQAGLAGTVRA